MPELEAGTWLGIDIGSGRDKVCSFCLVESDEAGKITVTFERGPAEEPYPAKNSFDALIDPDRAPTYLREEIEGAVSRVLAESALVRRWLQSLDAGRPGAVGIDAPVALAVRGQRNRATERASTDLFDTPDRATFESKLGTQKPGYYPINIYWKCIGFATHRWLAKHLAPDLPGDFPQETVAAWTCPGSETPWKIRETFPSDVYKRATQRDPGSGATSRLSPEARNVLRSLVRPEVPWRGADSRNRPSKSTLQTLRKIRSLLGFDLEEGVERPCEMRKRPGTPGDLWDAFTCAYTVCSEAHGGGEFHGWSEDPEAAAVLRREGAILTVRRKRGGRARAGAETVSRRARHGFGSGSEGLAGLA